MLESIDPLENIKKQVIAGDHIKCQFERHYMRSDQLSDKPKQRDCDCHLWCDERSYTLLYRNDTFIIKTDQWHDAEKSSSWDYLVEKWFDKNGTLVTSEKYVLHTKYLKYPGLD